MLSTSWKESLSKGLEQAYGAKKGAALYNSYHQAFDASYREESSVERIVKDLGWLEKMSAENFIELDFYRENDAKGESLHLRIFKNENPIPLSDIMPILENFDFRALSERSYEVALLEKTIYISDFKVSSVLPSDVDMENLRQLFHEALIELCAGRFESDGFNKLILGAGLAPAQVTILRAYAKYLRQVGFRFTQVYIEQALANNAAIARKLAFLFLTRLDPDLKPAQREQAVPLEAEILEALEKVSSLDEDLIIRRLLDLINATLRTNYFQRQNKDQPKPYLSIKFDSRAIPELPQPLPLYEIFVYSPRFEGIHLRGGKVARGGIRWSDRREDFRREILGLMKAQTVKNAIIVPTGAKGGFVLKALSPRADREGIKLEVVSCYQLFIRGLLDLTDNLKDGKVIHPKRVLCLDDADTYLVVAADKGTASFSDIANALSKEYGFWLDDAFASGGITGYDHKKMGITARGAWESVKRHFCGLGVDIITTPITVVGVGDMSGDVFGNGLLYTNTLKLVAAFDHRHIFIDPNPDPVLSFQERERLFKLPASSWEDYNATLLSQGGGIYKRSAKIIHLSAEARQVLGIKEETMMPQDLVRALLKAPVDLLWNGGIGTYVKASTETQADVGDKANDLNRVNGVDLRCRVVGEGGNLGFTQRGRIEYALLNKGLINTDFIDNSAGVDCSDHEVNLKILLNAQVRKGKLTEEKRNQLLTEVTQEVAALVLKDNFSQAWILGFLNQYSYGDTVLYQGYINELEAMGKLNRQVEFLPEDKAISDRRAAGQGLSSPELAILMAYTKIYLKSEILKSDLPEDPYFQELFGTAFPETIMKLYHKGANEHGLHREIIATQAASRLVNEMGFSFAYRMQSETGASIKDIFRAHAAASAIFGTREVLRVIQKLDFKITLTHQYELMHHVRHLMNISSRWFLHENRLDESVSEIIDHYAERAKLLEKLILELMSGTTRHYLEGLQQEFIKVGLTPEVAIHIASYRVAYTSLNIIEVATKHHLDLLKTAKLYFLAGERFHLVWFRDYIANDKREGSWNALARLTLRDELDDLQKMLTVEMMKALKKEDDIEKLICAWKEKNAAAFNRWEKMMVSVHESSSLDYSMFFIVLKELGNLLKRK